MESVICMKKNNLYDTLFININFILLGMSFIIISFIKISEILSILGTFISIWHFYYFLIEHKLKILEFIVKYISFFFIIIIFYYCRYSNKELFFNSFHVFVTFCNIEIIFIFTSLLCNKLFRLFMQDWFPWSKKIRSNL